MSYDILLIEDNVEMAENVAAILELAKYNVMHAANGRIGVDLAQKCQPDLILCDVMMPELDGYGVLHILSKAPETAGIPFVFLTAKADHADFRMGMNLGADDYVTKPFDSVDLLKVIETRLKKHEQAKTFNDQNVHTSFNMARALKDFRRLAENRASKSFKRKDFVYMEGQTPHDVFLLESGRVKTYKVNYDGKELITGIHQAGDFLGFVSLLEDKPYGESAEVLENARVTIIPKDDFLALIYSSKDVAQRFMKILSRDLETMEKRLLHVAYQSLRQRVANTLLDIEAKLEASGEGAIFTMARRDISNIVGTATESLNRTLADFKSEGLIEILATGLRIRDHAKLKRLGYR